MKILAEFKGKKCYIVAFEDVTAFCVFADGTVESVRLAELKTLDSYKLQGESTTKILAELNRRKCYIVAFNGATARCEFVDGTDSNVLLAELKVIDKEYYL